MGLLNLLCRRPAPAPPAPEVVGQNRFKGWLLVVQRLMGSDGEDYYVAVAKRLPRVDCGCLQWAPGDLHTGFWPTFRCALIEGKNLVDREIRRDAACRRLDTIIERWGDKAFQL